jgi:ribosome-associated protein
MPEAVTEEDIPKSKTQRKQEMLDLQKVGQQLVAVSLDRLKQLNLDEALLNAVLQAKKTTQNGALRRQMQYIGKIMRSVDAAPIVAKLDDWAGSSKQEAAKFHLLERWRERLLQDETALTTLLESYPQADAQHLRNLIRNAHKEQAANKPPKSSRALFQELRGIILGRPGTTEEVHQDADGQE